MPTGERRLKVLFVASEVAPFREDRWAWPTSPARCRGRCATRGIDIRVVMPLYQGMPWNDLERLDGTLTVPMYFGQARAGVRLGQPAGQRPAHLLHRVQPLLRPAAPLRAARASATGQPRAFLVPVARRAGAVQDDRLHPRRHPRQRLADRAGARVREHGRVGQAAARRRARCSRFTTWPTRANFESGAMFITGLGGEHYNSAEFEHFGDMNLMKAAIRHANLLSTVSPTYAREIQTSGYGFGLDGELALRGGNLRGVLNGIDTERMGPGTRLLHRGPVQRRRSIRQGQVQSVAAEAARPRRAAGRALVRRGRAPDAAEGLRRPGARAGHDLSLGSCRWSCSATGDHEAESLLPLPGAPA